MNSGTASPISKALAHQVQSESIDWRFLSEYCGQSSTVQWQGQRIDVLQYVNSAGYSGRIGVDSHMPVQIAGLREAKQAEPALVRFLARVGAQVLGERGAV